jgi:hypothetical protein
MDALVLSIGATEGDFEVGAARRLFELGVTPDLIAGTSVGAINAAKLAEGENRGTATIPSGLAGLELVWLSLNSDSDMYVPNPDVDLSAVLQAAGNLGLDVFANLVGAVLLGPGGVPLLALFDLTKGVTDVQSLQAAVNTVLNSPSLYLLTPIGVKLATQLDQGLVRTSGIRLLLPTVSLEDGVVRFVNELGEVLNADLSQHQEAPPGNVSPACQPLQDQLDAVLTQIQDLAEQHATGGLEALRARAARLKLALASCEQANPAPGTVPVVVTLAEGALASASIPVIFTPTKLGNQNYVDGGVRAPVAVAAAVASGASRVIVVVTFNSLVPGPAADPLTMTPIASFDSQSLLQVAFRVAQDIMPSQIQADDLAPAANWGTGPGQADVVIIAPFFRVHYGLSIDPGLIRIAMANGYMRADDAMAARALPNVPDGFGPAYQAALDGWSTTPGITTTRHAADIISKRTQIWQREYAANGYVPQDPLSKLVAPAPAPGGPDPAALSDVRAWKRDLKVLVDNRVAAGGAVPSGPETLSDWWLDWEQHQFQPTAPLWTDTAAFGQMTVTFTPQGPFNDGQTVAFVFSAVDQLAPGPDLQADILLNGVQQPGSTGPTPVSLTLKVTKKIERIFEDGKPETVIITTDPVIEITKAGYTPVQISPAMTS